MQLCAQGEEAPATPTHLTLLPIQGGNATLLHWTSSDEAKAVLQTFVVEESVGGGAYRPLVGQNLIATAWLHRHGPRITTLISA